MRVKGRLQATGRSLMWCGAALAAVAALAGCGSSGSHPVSIYSSIPLLRRHATVGASRYRRLSAALRLPVGSGIALDTPSLLRFGLEVKRPRTIGTVVYAQHGVSVVMYPDPQGDDACLIGVSTRGSSKLCAPSHGAASRIGACWAGDASLVGHGMSLIVAVLPRGANAPQVMTSPGQSAPITLRHGVASYASRGAFVVTYRLADGTQAFAETQSLTGSFPISSRSVRC